jgi:hypothetical protein
MQTKHMKVRNLVRVGKGDDRSKQGLTFMVSHGEVRSYVRVELLSTNKVNNKFHANAIYRIQL